MIIVYGAKTVAAFCSAGMASLVVDNDAVHSLESIGNPGMLRAVCERAEVFCKGEHMVCVVEKDHPQKAKLMKLYAKFGFNYLGLILKREMKWAE